VYPLSIPGSAFKELRKGQDTVVRFSQADGGGYLAGLEVFHQVCLFFFFFFGYGH